MPNKKKQPCNQSTINQPINKQSSTIQPTDDSYKTKIAILQMPVVQTLNSSYDRLSHRCHPSSFMPSYIHLCSFDAHCNSRRQHPPPPPPLQSSPLSTTVAVAVTTTMPTPRTRFQSGSGWKEGAVRKRRRYWHRTGHGITCTYTRVCVCLCLFRARTRTRAGDWLPLQLGISYILVVICTCFLLRVQTIRTPSTSHLAAPPS